MPPHRRGAWLKIPQRSQKGSKEFDNFRNELEVQLHCKQSKPETLFTKMISFLEIVMF